MPPVSPDESASYPPSRVLIWQKENVLRALLTICDNLQRLESDPSARQACFEVSELLRSELRALRRRGRGRGING